MFWLCLVMAAAATAESFGQAAVKLPSMSPAVNMMSFLCPNDYVVHSHHILICQSKEDKEEEK